MSQENVEIVRASYEDFVKTGQMSDEFVDPDVVWDSIEGWPGAKEFRGRDAIMQFYSEWLEPYDEFEQGMDLVRDAGDDRVLLIARQRGRLRGSGAWVDFHYGLVYTVQGDKITRIKAYSTPEEALEAVGLSE
jgi:ketosteroid isomerase-like protein